MFFYSLMPVLDFTLNISMVLLLISCNSIVWQMSLLFENWAIYRFSCYWVHLDTFQGGIGHLGEDFDNVHILPNSLVHILPTA